MLLKWVHPQRRLELDEEAIVLIATSTDDEALEALKELCNWRTFWWGNGHSLTLPVLVEADSHHHLEGLVDSGCEGSCINWDVVKRLGLKTKKLTWTILVFNADGHPNTGGPVTEIMQLNIEVAGWPEWSILTVVDQGGGEIFLGHDWLQVANPAIDWAAGWLVFRRRVPYLDLNLTQEDELMEEFGIGQLMLWIDWLHPTPIDWVLAYALSWTLGEEDGFRLHMVLTPTQWLAEEDFARCMTVTVELPTAYANFKDIFDKREFDTLPPCRIWDHTIDLIEGTEPCLDCKIYPLSQIEQEKLDKFLEENFRMNQIQPSKSPMASPFFFIKKKDSLLWLVQDYWWLNAITVPDQYPIPLIPELINSLQQAKIFSKLDVWWGYNNIRIKDGDEFKAAFRMNCGLYELQVMFFGLTNSPATFQQMMNEILKELVAMGNVLVYLDDTLIFTETWTTTDRYSRWYFKNFVDIDCRSSSRSVSSRHRKWSIWELWWGMDRSGWIHSRCRELQTSPPPPCIRMFKVFLGFVTFIGTSYAGSLGSPSHSPNSWAWPHLSGLSAIKMHSMHSRQHSQPPHSGIADEWGPISAQSRCISLCCGRHSLTEAGWRLEAHHFHVKSVVTNTVELWDIW
jgi:hypothetical protein